MGKKKSNSVYSLCDQVPDSTFRGQIQGRLVIQRLLKTNNTTCKMKITAAT